MLNPNLWSDRVQWLLHRCGLSSGGSLVRRRKTFRIHVMYDVTHGLRERVYGGLSIWRVIMNGLFKFKDTILWWDVTDLTEFKFLTVLVHNCSYTSFTLRVFNYHPHILLCWENLFTNRLDWFPFVYLWDIRS